MSGKRILNDRYVIDENNTRLGGTATVYKAVDMKDHSTVAVKIFNQTNMSPALTKEACQRDMKSLYELNTHENIAKIIDHGDDTDSGCSYIVIEWLNKNLIETIRDNPIQNWDDFYSNYGRKILNALSFSHQRDIIHRDIKPENILFTDNNELRIIDFGISKVKRLWGGVVTFADWKSPPYSPPETNNFHNINTRDIYSFAALSVACLERRELDADENLIELLESHNVEQGVFDILSECLSEYSQDRQQSIDGLIDSLDRFVITNTKSTNGLMNCYLILTDTATQQLQLYLNIADKTSIENSVSRDLNEVCGIERANDGSEHYFFKAANYSYRVALDEKEKKYFIIVSVFNQEAWRLEDAREHLYIPQTIYNIGRPPNNKSVKESTLSILENLSIYEADAYIRNKGNQERKLINTWRAQLRLKYDLEQIAKNKIDYSDFEIFGDSIEFTVKADEFGDTIGQERIIQGVNNNKYTIVIDKVESNKIISYTNDLSADEIPKSGTLALDTFLQAIDRKRQETALDDFLFERSYRADLKKLIFDPSLSKEPIPQIPSKFFQEGLDESKQEIVSAVLGSEDFLVINGPPGTGKTMLIAEIVLQFLMKYPNTKILISSQTHNAVDNALERIRKVKNNDAELRAVRIAKKNDSRVSDKLKDLTLDNLVSTWIDQIKINSTLYIEEWSRQNGVDKSEIELGLAVRTLKERLYSYHKEIDERERLIKELERLDSSISKAKQEKIISNDFELMEFNKDQTKLSLREVEGNLVKARKLHREAQSTIDTEFKEGKDLCELSVEELTEWEHEFLSSSKSKEQCMLIIELLQDWYDRFGKSIDFHAAYLSDSRIVASTCSGIGLKNYKNIKFDLCIIDEASKATPTETLLPMVKSKRWIFVGDPVQLPPFVQQGDTNLNLLSKHHLTKNDLESTILNLLIEKLPSKSVMALNTQYRMSPEIGKLISECFYGGQLITGRGDALPLKKYLAIKNPVTWYCTSKLKDRFETRVGKSFVNYSEANYIGDILARINFAAKRLNKQLTVCILSFYSEQINVLKGVLAKFHSQNEMLSIDCDTVDSFQGREADISIISITRNNKNSNFGFINDLNRINVALSRSKEALIIVGDSHFCSQSDNSPLNKVINHINNNKEDCSLVEIDNGN